MTRFISFVSGKGGVGKTSLAINVSHVLQNLGKSVVLVDANIATPNVGLYLGVLRPGKTLNQFLEGNESLHEIVQEHQSGLHVVYSDPSYSQFKNTSPERLKHLFSRLSGASDYVVVDSPSGFGEDVLPVIEHSDEVILVVIPTMASIMEAMKNIELCRSKGTMVTGAILNMNGTWWSKPSLDVNDVENLLGIPVLTALHSDKKFPASQHLQEPYVSLYPRRSNSRKLRELAEKMYVGK